MRLRILLEPHHGASYAQILALAKAAEEGGFDAFFRSDHYLGIDANDVTYQPTDSWTTLAGLAVQTERVRLGTLVNASTFRLPGQLAVEVATVDQMSGGRAELGIGAAWYEREHQYFGIPFPPLGERFDRLEEQLAILTGIWDTPPGERFSYDGKFYQVQDCVSIPRWASRPKIIIGGALLVLVAEAVELARKLIWILPIGHEVRKFVVRQQFLGQLRDQASKHLRAFVDLNNRALGRQKV